MKIKLFDKLKIPDSPGIYFFKDKLGEIIYIGKAKDLKERVSSYFSKQAKSCKSKTIVESSDSIEFRTTENELEAFMLEAQLIRDNQPRFNVLLKFGQPYVYLLFTKKTKIKLPEMKLARDKKEDGVYWGPIFEKNHAKQAYDFLSRTLRLKLCNKKIENGCLAYHMGICSGSCRKDFDEKDYFHRLEIARKSISQNNESFLKSLENEIEKSNKYMDFDKSRKLHEYFTAFEKVFSSIRTNFTQKYSNLGSKDLWISKDNLLILFGEVEGIITKKRVFLLDEEFLFDFPLSILKAFYNQIDCPGQIFTNFQIPEKELFQEFLELWHKKNYPVSIKQNPVVESFNLALSMSSEEVEKNKELGRELKKQLKLSALPITIDCFDVSHHQSKNLVGVSVRFKNGKSDKNEFRKFNIKTTLIQNDYACLQEIAMRRYKNKKDLPDLILVDGGKGQLAAVKKVVPAEIEIVALAKREETVFSNKFLEGKKLDPTKLADQFLIYVRDYAHHFAISFHRQKDKIYD